MTDHELCLAAAKAAGYLTATWEGNEAYIAGMMSRWNPLDSDSDAFRLMVDCGRMDLHCGENATRAANEFGYFVEPHGTDKHAATRRAIVRAAAAMVKV